MMSMEKQKEQNEQNEIAETGCCPKFDPATWANKETMQWEGKKFIKANVRSIFYMPLNMGSVITKTWKAIEDAHAAPPEDEFIILSKDVSPWKSEQYFPVTKDVPAYQTITLSGTYTTKVFEGPYQEAKNWAGEMHKLVKAKGKNLTDLYFYYTTCPKCAKVYGKNYVVGIARGE